MEKTLPQFIIYIVNFLLAAGGVLTLAALIYGGFSYITSFGDVNRIKKAREIILAAILGLIILLSSYIILKTLDPRLIILEMPEIKIFELKRPKFPEIDPKRLPAGCEMIPIKRFINGFIDLKTDEKELKNVFKESLDLAASLYKTTDKVAFLSRGANESFDKFAEEEIRNNPGLLEEFKKEFKKELEEKVKGIEDCQDRGRGEHKDKTCKYQIEQRKGSLFDLLKEIGRKEIMGGVAELATFCRCKNLTSICLVPCCGCPSICPQEGDPCPSDLKGRAIPQLTGEIKRGREIIPKLEDKIHELEILRADLEANLRKARDCRTDKTKELFTCAEAKDVRITAECDELDFYCCQR